ncbi:hypothetical protein INT45_012991 [Circinella minor]|uniref:Heterokaryon incompatibility domain-containing protein n=1 Tax=Circinella minor TaxID=1195481 RepID=A0A8H7RX47_9FUNG|nr:hypothetical protein INT45_012991 [Circinella minor]
MYITYCRNQKSVDLEDRTDYRLSLTGGDYRPTWLVRVSDWEKVPGTEAVDGYHTISYCWEQSGEVVKNETNEEYSLVDNGKHCIVEDFKLFEDSILQWEDFYNALIDIQEVDKEVGERKIRKIINPIKKRITKMKMMLHNKEEHQEDNQKNDEEKDKEDASKVASDNHEEEYLMDFKDYVLFCVPQSKTTRIRYVTYEELLQQVCKDFQVEYVWYDKVCIDQKDNKAKSKEIKQMHKIYQNGRYTIAMIPEAAVIDPKDFEHKVFATGHKAQDRLTNCVWESCWFKRSWTLEEVMMARRILIVGTNTNMFQNSLHTNDVPTTIDFLSSTLLDFGGRTEQNKGSVNQALAYAHFRTSTKPHDMIYALKNTFYHMFDGMEISYSTNIKTAFNDFYRHVVTNDLSILCFGSNLRFDGDARLKSTMDSYNLPSWTGVSGSHADSYVSTTLHSQLKYHIDDTMWMYITTKHYWKIPVKPYDHGCYSFPKTSRVENAFYAEKIDRINRDRCHKDYTNDLTTANKHAILLEWIVNINAVTGCYMTHYHQPQDGLLTQIRPLTLTEDCEECIILPILLESHTEICIQRDEKVSNFTIGRYDHDYCLPVLRECTEGTGRYKAIGVYYIGEGNKISDQPTFQWNHCIGRDDIFTDDPKKILSSLFENDDHDTLKEFIIE